MILAIPLTQYIKTETICLPNILSLQFKTIQLFLYTGGKVNYHRNLGTKKYELSNHLGNVLTIITDNIGMDQDSAWAKVVNTSDYYPFGLEMESRVWRDSTADYRYGFNGKEKDQDGEFGLTTYDYGFRIYNPAIGKFLSVDPLTASYPMLTPYQFASNMPIAADDLDGLEARLRIHYPSNQNKSAVTITDQSKIFRTLSNFQSHPGFKWSSRESQVSFVDNGYISLQGSDGKDYDFYLGTVSLQVANDGSATAYFDDFQSDFAEALKEIDFQSRRFDIIKQGLFDFGIGTTAVFTAGVEEVISGGTVTPIAWAQFAFGVDEMMGGINQMFNPREYANGEESKPVAFLMKSVLGQTGEVIYTTLDLSTGVGSVAYQFSKYGDSVRDFKELTWTLVGTYDTVKDADAARDKLILNRQSQKKE